MVFAVVSTDGTQIVQALVADGPPVKVAIECPLFPEPVVKHRSDDPPAVRIKRFKLTDAVVRRKSSLVLRESTLVGGTKRVFVHSVRVGSEAYTLGLRKNDVIQQIANLKCTNKEWCLKLVQRSLFRRDTVVLLIE